MAHPLGFYSKQGLNVEVTKTAGWALIRDKMINKEYDATHFLSPMPLAISLGLGSNATPMNVATIQNINGQAITLASSTRTTATPRTGRASSSPSRSSTQHAQLPVALLPGRKRPEPRHRRADCA
jgi:ABC-type nitrate/sulfonate/bicarbonate transport system substrate-binding protein